MVEAEEIQIAILEHEIKSNKYQEFVQNIITCLQKGRYLVAKFLLTHSNFEPNIEFKSRFLIEIFLILFQTDKTREFKEIFKTLVIHPKIDLNNFNKNQNTLAHLCHDIEIIKTCIGKINLNQKNKFDQTAIDLAIIQNSFDYAKYLFSEKCPLSTNKVIDKAIVDDNLNILKFLKSINISFDAITVLSRAWILNKVQIFKYLSINLEQEKVLRFINRIKNNEIIASLQNNVYQEILKFKSLSDWIIEFDQENYNAAKSYLLFCCFQDGYFTTENEFFVLLQKLEVDDVIRIIFLRLYGSKRDVMVSQYLKN